MLVYKVKKNMKKISLSLVILATVLTFASTSFAVDSLGQEIKNSVKAEIEANAQISTTPGQLGKNIKKAVKNRLEDNFLNKVKSFLKKNLRFEARVSGEITVIGTDSFSIEGEDGTFEINVTDKTQLLMKFGGKSKLGDFKVGDEVKVFGKFTDETKLTIDAKVVKNNSIQKRKGAFFGKVTVKNDDNFVMETLKRGIQTVYFETAKFVQRNEKDMTYSDVKVGDRVRVKGTWDKSLNKITDIIQIKDFSITAIVPTESAED